MKDFMIKLIRHPFFITLVLAGVVSLGILYGTLKWLESYTRHNEAVVVPDVKGLKVDDAVAFLNNSELRYSIIDSVFSKAVPPGAIVETVPAAGSKVKKGRILFLTVNAVTSQMGEIPEVEDLSYRQAYALLTSRGFESVKIEYVNGVYKDLAIGVEMRGRLLSRGDKVPLNSSLVLKVSSGETDPFEGDTLAGDSLPDGWQETTSGEEPRQTPSIDNELEKW